MKNFSLANGLYFRIIYQYKRQNMVGQECPIDKAGHLLTLCPVR